MSVFRKFINHYNSLPIGSIINTDSISIHLYLSASGSDNTNIYICVGRYIDYLVDSKFIEYSHSKFEKLLFIENYIVDKLFYTKIHDIPNIDSLSIRKLKRLSTDDKYRINYMRKAKLEKLKI